MLKAEQDFVEEYARTLLVDWCCQTLHAGRIADHRATASTEAQKHAADLCLALAQEKGWVSASEPRKVLASGFSRAAAFLRR